MTLNELSDITGRDIILRRYAKQGTRWIAKLEGSLVIEQGHEGSLVSGYGDGASPHEALSDYVRYLQGATLVFNSGEKDRAEFGVPSTLVLE